MSADFEVDVPQGTARLTIELFDRFAGHVRTLADESNPAPGKRTFTWDLRDDQGEPVPLRQYMVRVSCDDISESRLVFLQRHSISEPTARFRTHLLGRV